MLLEVASRKWAHCGGKGVEIDAALCRWNEVCKQWSVCAMGLKVCQENIFHTIKFLCDPTI